MMYSFLSSVKVQAVATAAALFLWAGPVLAQGFGGVACFAFPCQSTVASLPTPDGTQGVRVVLDGSTATDCTVGGGAAVVLCLDTGAAWEAVGGAAGTDDQTAVEVPYTPTVPTDWTDPDPTEVLSGLDDLAGRLTVKENETLAGDVTGPPSATVVGDDTHAHTTTTVSGLDTADVTTGTWADARVAASNVTQHQAVIDHDALTNFVAAEHVPAVVVNNNEYCQGGPSVTFDCDVTIIPEADIDALLHRDAETKDGDLVDFDDVNGDYIASDLDSALEELVSVNMSGPNAVDGKVEWSQLAGVPAGFADGTDDGGSAAFSDLTTGTNTAATMTVGTGASLVPSGTGTVRATALDSNADGNYEIRMLSDTLEFRPHNPAPATTMWEMTAGHFRSANGGGAYLLRESPSATNPTISPNNTVPTFGLGSFGASSLYLIVNSTTAYEVTDSTTVSHVKRVDLPQAVTCTDSGDANPGALTLVPITSKVHLTNGDIHGCDVTMSESGAINGQMVRIVVISNAGGTVNFSDTPGVTELEGAFAAGLWDNIAMDYTVDRWVEISRKDN